MQLSYLLQPIMNFSPHKNIEIKGLALDSRKVKQGDAFLACQGVELHGIQFIDEAVKNGASVVLVDRLPGASSVPVILIPDLSNKIGLIASRFYHNPSQKMQVVGITGTNGKTSCSHFIASILHEFNLSCGIIGTLGNGLYGKIQPANLTTPDAITLQKTLAEFVEQGAKYTAMEVSSHSLIQERVNAIEFTIGVFTNLTRDHLDYHGNMENYGDAKKKLFTQHTTQYDVINADDSFGQQLISMLDAGKLFSYGIEKNATVYAEKVHLDLKGIRALVHSPWGKSELVSELIGRFNLNNLLAVLTSLCLLGIPFEKVLYGISKLKPINGRMQTLGEKNKPLVVIDYAHTPDALEKVLIALRAHCQGKLYCIFGCGGDRDRGKRPMMAEIAERLSDYILVTDDNPRTESPEQIFNDISSGFLHPIKVSFQHDRAKTIQEAILTAKAEDCILIAGKGAENYQIIGKEKYPFSDIEQARLSLGLVNN